ncbi:serine hydrolase domain-containing protein [Glaciecola petra]|uniref:Serine hydrolase domain-containing protein n=1 Tax=Glaciecola petra TaxID=3075602 RepID=A0ABU2ZTA8_9ALTE|nr:serine hydrolase domain-containing protein [Aestuariibacter sp. P117]MDT0595268.1 serine hydrolase domain-containing protein [Aestuariibacter sp. P117]
MTCNKTIISRKKHNIFCFISLFFTFCFTLNAQNETTIEKPIESTNSSQIDINALRHFIDGYVDASINDFDPPGMVVSVVLGEQQITKGYGIANAETGALNTDETLFRIGSISKLFVWLSAHMLAEEGKLDLNAPVNNYFDGFAIEDAFDRQITMRDLMSHRPGFEDSLKDFLDPNRNVSIEEAVATGIPNRVAPAGERTSYSNSGTNIAAYVVEQVSGLSFYEFVEQRILAPVGLQSTTLRDPGIERNPLALEQRMAKPHKIENGTPVVINYMAVRPQEPVGAVAMDAKDAAIFMRMLLDGTQYKGGRLLSQESWERIKKPAFEDAIGGDDMGWGFMLNDVDGFATVGHGGATQFLSWMFIIPELDMGVFVSSNMNSSGARGEGLAWSIARQISKTGTIDKFLAIEGNPEAAKLVAGNYLNNRRDFTSGAAMFSLASDIQITATDDGYLVFPGTPSVRYAPLNDQIWVSKSGRRIRVVTNEAGEVLRLHSSLGSSTLERISFISTSGALFLGFGGVVLLSMTSLLGMYYRYGRGLTLTPIGKKLAWINIASVVSWSTFFASLAFAAMSLSELDITTIDDTSFPPTSVKVAFALSVLLCLVALLHILSVIPAWFGSQWPIWRRITYTMYAMFSVFAVYLLYHWNLIGASIYGL